MILKNMIPKKKYAILKCNKAYRSHENPWNKRGKMILIFKKYIVCYLSFLGFECNGKN